MSDDDLDDIDDDVQDVVRRFVNGEIPRPIDREHEKHERKPIHAKPGEAPEGAAPRRRTGSSIVTY